MSAYEKKPASRFVLYALVGLAIGVACEWVASYAASSGSYQPGAPRFLAHFADPHIGVLIERIVYALLGLICGWAGEFFDRDTWSVTKASVANFLVIVPALTVTGALLGWTGAAGWAGIAGMVLVVVAIWIVIWCVAYLMARRQIARTNTELMRRHTA